MNALPKTAERPDARHRLRWRYVALLVGVSAALVLALLFVPVHSSAQAIQFGPDSSATANVSIPAPGWVTVHFDQPYVGGGMGGMGHMGMHYWMSGGGGMMFDHGQVSGSDSYSFWSWGGTYHCGAGFPAGTRGPGMMTIWVNATWATL